MKPAVKDGGRLIVVRPDRVGDVIISSSCLPALRAAFPRSEIFFAATGGMAPLFCRHPLLAGFLPLPPGGPWWRQASAWHRLWRRLMPDAVVFLHPEPVGYAMAWLGRIPVRAGLRTRGWGWTLTQGVFDERRQGLKHEASYSFHVLKELGVEEPPVLRASLALDPEAQAAVGRLLPWPRGGKSFVVLHPSAFSPVARWAPGRFVEVALALRARHAWEVVVIGADAADPSVVEVMDGLKNRGISAVNLAGKTGLAELGWILREAGVLITRDTGPSHLAAAVDCPVVVLFGRASPLYGPVRWRPLGGRVEIVAASVERRRRERNPDYWRRCFDAIEVADVIQAVEKLV